jgi:NAD(P)-dependent dehydrogenase (short-subunit alcohol dehydrogenase family)
MEKTFTVNHFGHFILTLQLLEKLRQCAPSRVISVTSESHKKSLIPKDDTAWLFKPMNTTNYDIYESYGRSKLANVLFAEELNRRYAKDGVTSYAVHPGKVLFRYHTSFHIKSKGLGIALQRHQFKIFPEIT